MNQTHPSAALADLRKTYALAELTEADAGSDPYVLFQRWLNEAMTAQVPEPNAMTLATVGSDLRPSTRIVLIKGLDERGIVWFTNYQSRKGVELAGNPFAALQFHWVELERTVRIEGVVEKTSDEQSDAYFHSRPLDSRVGAWASPQSQVIAGRQMLDAWVAQHNTQFGLSTNAQGRTVPANGTTTADVPRPPHWGGYRLKPDTWQFWQGRPNRLHDRLRFELEGDAWVRTRLAP
jgi:pyridoxamine 5'-phosphate oxidase